MQLCRCSDACCARCACSYLGACCTPHMGRSRHDCRRSVCFRFLFPVLFLRLHVFAACQAAPHFVGRPAAATPARRHPPLCLIPLPSTCPTLPSRQSH